MRDLDALLDAAAIDTVCCGGDRPVGLLTKRDTDTLGVVTPSTKLKAEAILDAAEARFGVRPQTVWGAGSLPEHNNLRCLDIMVTTLDGGWLGGSKTKAWEIGDWVVELVWANRARWGLRHIIWRRRIISTTTSPGVWRPLPDRGSTTANHEDHPHINFASDAWEPPVLPGAPGRHRTVTVKRGDTLLAIAVALGVSLAALRAANPQITDPNVIVPGQVITVPDSAPVVPGSVAPTPVPAPAPAPAPAPTVIAPPKVTVSASPLRQGTRSAAVKAYQIRIRDWLAKRIGWAAVNRLNPHKATGYFGPETTALTLRAYAVLRAAEPGQWGRPGGYPVPGPALLHRLGLR